MSKILEAMRETAKGLYDAGVMDAYTMREIEELCLAPLEEFAPEEIKELRIQHKLSQPVLARYMNVQPVTVKKWESGASRPGGSALKLLHILKKHGLEPLAH